MFYHKKTIRKKCDNFNIGTEELFEEYQKKKRTYNGSFFDSKYGYNPKDKKVKIGIALFKKILLTYLQLYFWQLYMNGSSRYFFLGGLMKLTAYEKITKVKRNNKNNTKKVTQTNRSISLYWYLRPSVRMFYMVDIIKLTGSTNRIPMIERVHAKSFDKDLLPIFIDELRRDKKNKTQYLCTLH